MCLITRMTEPVVADSDITVYKIMVSRAKRDKEILEAPVMPDFRYKAGKPYRVKDRRFADTESRDEYTTVRYGFHSFLYNSGAMLALDCYNKIDGSDLAMHGKRYCIVECVIPKGARYYHSIEACPYTELCSQELVVKRVLEYAEC